MKDLLEALNGVGGNISSLISEDKNNYQDISKGTSSIELSSGTNTNDLLNYCQNH